MKHYQSRKFITTTIKKTLRSPIACKSLNSNIYQCVSLLGRNGPQQKLILAKVTLLIKIDFFPLTPEEIERVEIEESKKRMQIKEN